MSSKSAIKIFLGMQMLLIIFHLCIVLKIIPYDITWGGRLTNDAEMYQFESISLFIILFLCLTLLIRGNYIKQYISEKATTIILWIFMFLFALNTIGNVLATTVLEKFFTILTLFSCILIWFILRPLKKGK